MMPDGSITKPEPSEETLRARGPPSLPFFLKNSSKNSSNGEPGGSCGICTPFCASIVCDVEIFTTASVTRSAISATESGTLPEAAKPGLAESAANPAAKPSAATERKEILVSVDMASSKKALRIFGPTNCDGNLAGTRRRPNPVFTLSGVRISTEKRHYVSQSTARPMVPCQ